MSSANRAILWRYFAGRCLSIALWNAVCWTWLDGLHPIVNLFHANTPSCVWKHNNFLDSSSKGIDQYACIASALIKYLKPWSFLISSVASGKVLATGLRQSFMIAFIVTRYEVGGEFFGIPGSNLGTITRRDIHLGSSHFSTTGVALTKCSITFWVAGLWL